MIGMVKVWVIVAPTLFTPVTVNGNDAAASPAATAAVTLNGFVGSGVSVTSASFVENVGPDCNLAALAGIKLA